MKLQFAIENNNMPEKPERSSKTTCKCCHTKRWQVAILAFYTILLHATFAVTAEAADTMTTAATVLTSETGSPPLNQSTNKVLHRGLRVPLNGDAIILCKTTDLSNTRFYDETGKKVSHLLHVKNELLKSYAVLFLRGITKNSTYLCKEGDKIISSTTIKIANPSLSTPVRVEMANGDDAALIFQHKGAKNITYKRHALRGGGGGSEKIDIIDLDNSTALMLIRNAAEQKSMLTFRYDNGHATNESEFYVGHEPEPVTNFDCRGENYDYMVCEFNPPPNNLPMEYRISYNIDSPNQINCQMNFQESRIFLNLTLSDSCTYLPGGKTYNFTLIGSNVLGSFTREFLINNHEHVVPAKLKINITNITDHSAQLSWDNVNRSYFKDLIYRIIIQAKGFENHTIIKSNSTMKYDYVLKNLKFANWPYTVYVDARVSKNSKWSEATVVSFVTEQRRPDRAPSTFPGSFYIHENNITLYWEELAPYERNGENFTYIIRDLSENTSAEDSLKTTKSSIDFRWSGENKVYSIYAKNAAGMSQTGSTIHVKLPVNIEPPQYIERLVLENGTFKLLWKYADGVPKPSNYTVFWCRALLTMATKCEGAMHFKEVNSNTTEFIMDSKEPRTILAIAANYPSGSTGLHWPSCSSNLNEPLGEIDLEAKARSAKEISLSWYDKNCVNAFDTYNITYCEVKDGVDLNCQRTSSTSDQEKHLILHDLKEYTVYNITIQALGSNHIKSPLSKSVICQTNEAAPEPPKNVDYVRDSITSTSVNISWDAPVVTNGILRHYTIWYKMASETIYKDKTISASSGLSAKLEELNSGSTYEIYVTAWTTEESTASETIRITTMIGIPSYPAKTALEKHGDYYIFNWTLPDMRAGHVDLYELILMENEKKSILSVKRVSDGPQICLLKFPDCTDGIQSMEVRAVNLVTKDQLDRHRFRIAETGEEEKSRRERRHSDPAYPTSQVYTQATTNAKDKRNSNDTTPKEITTAPPANKRNHKIAVYRYKAHKDFKCEELSSSLSLVLPNDAQGEYYMLTSESRQNSNQFHCAQFPWQYMVAIFIFFIMAITSLIWGYNKINEKMNIKVELPASILQLMSMSIKLPTEMEINKADNISIVSTKTNDSKSLINKDSHHYHINQRSSASSSGESGVGGIGGDDSVSPSTSSEDVNGEYTRGWSQDVPSSPQTTTTLNSFSQSSPAHQRTPALKCGNGGITIKDDYLLVEQITNNKFLPMMDDRSISSDSTYLPLHSIKSRSSSLSESGTFGDIGGSTKDNANAAILKKRTRPVIIQAKSSPTHPNVIKNFPIKTGDYVPPDSLLKLSEPHDAYLREDNNRSHGAFEPVRPNFLKTGNYVSPDAFSRMTASHNTRMNEDENKSEKTFQTQFLPPKSTDVSQTNLTNTNLMLATGAYVLPDSLPKIAASFSIEDENQKSQRISPKQMNGKSTHIQTNNFGKVNLATGDYVTPDALPKIAASFALKEENEKSQFALEKQQSKGRPNLCENLTFATGDYVSPDALPKIARSHGAGSAVAAAAAGTGTDHKPLQQQTKSPIVSYGYVTSDFWAQQQSAMK